MKESQLFTLLQFAGGTFPTGAFSQSWGLETYVEQGRIKDLTALGQFLQTYLDGVLASFEGPVLCHAYDLTKTFGLEHPGRLKELDQLATAMRLTREGREASRRTGKALLRIASGILNCPQLTDYYKNSADEGINYAVAFGMVAGICDVPLKAALSGFLFGSINAMVQSSVKLIPLGNEEAQRLLLEMQPQMKKAVDKAMHTPIEEAYSFCPALDIASIHHEDLPTRLYMS